MNLEATATPTKPSKSEWLAVAALLAVFFLAQLATRDLYPAVWCDEVTYSEPAINFAQTGKLVTTVWQFQPSNTYPSVNAPLYRVVLAGWLSLTDTSLGLVRMLNYVLVSVALLLVWIISWRLILVQQPGLRILLLLVASVGYGISFAYRCSRPDMLPLVLLLLLVLAFTVKSTWPRYLGVGLVAVILPWCSLNAGLYAGFGCGLGWLVWRRPLFRELIFVAALLGWARRRCFCF